MMPNPVVKPLRVAAALLLLSGTVSLVHAQEVRSAAAQAAAPLCLQKADGNGGTFTFLVPDDSAASLQARGFEARPCKGTAASYAQYREHMCRFAARAPEEALAQFARSFGATPAQLCGLAGQVLGLRSTNDSESSAADASDTAAPAQSAEGL